MIQETQVTLRKQTPTAPNEWLYQSTIESRDKEITKEDGVAETITEEVEVRNFVKSVYLGAGAEPWTECTEADRLAYEAEWAAQHPEESRTLDTEDTTEVAADAATQTPDTAEEGAGV